MTERKARAIGATWLDQQLIGGGQSLGDRGFGSEVRQALNRRAGFLIEQGLAEHRKSAKAAKRDELGERAKRFTNLVRNRGVGRPSTDDVDSDACGA